MFNKQKLENNRKNVFFSPVSCIDRKKQNDKTKK